MALPNYGLDADLKAKQDAKYDVELENEVAEWIEAITGEGGVKGNFHEGLKNGVLLCKVLNAIKPGTIKKINEGNMAFKQRENISNFVSATQTFGVHNSSVFGPDDLFDAKNLGSVVNCIYALGGAVQTSVPDFDGPKLGVADKSSAKQDVKQSSGVATQTGGLKGTMEKTELDMRKNIGKDAGQGTNPQVDAQGLDADLKAKKDANYDLNAENEVAEWIDAVTGSSVKGNFAEGLKSGVVLCQLLNKLKQGTIASINESTQPFKQRENISNFLIGAQKLGVRNAQVFNPDDLFDAKSLGAVVACIYALGGASQSSCPGFTGPKLGVADVSHAKADEARAVGPATQTCGLHAAMEKSEIDTSKNIVQNTGGATTAGGMTQVIQGSKGVMERSHIDKSKDVDRGVGSS